MELDKDIVVDFRAESIGLLKELEKIVENLEEAEGSFPENELKEFSQKIDRIMGAAKSLLMMAPSHLGIGYLAKVAEICKTIGYQAVALKRVALLPIFAGFWAETIETMNSLLNELESAEKTKTIVEKSSAFLQKRLEWLATKVAPHSDEEKKKVMELLKKL